MEQDNKRGRLIRPILGRHIEEPVAHVPKPELLLTERRIRDGNPGWTSADSPMGVIRPRAIRPIRL
jgi:hypothetical protein